MEGEWIKYTPGLDISQCYNYTMIGGNLMFIARRQYQGNLIVGTFIEAHRSIYISYEAHELRFDDDIEILKCGKYYSTFFRGHIPPNALIGGHENGMPLYVGLKKYNQGYILGKIPANQNSIYITCLNQVLQFDDNFAIIIKYEDY